MDSNAIFFGWNRSIPGRERTSGEHFGEFVSYLDGLKKHDSIDSYDVVFLTPHGGDMNGFFIIRGQNAKLDGVMGSEEWGVHMTRAAMHLEGSGAVRGQTGGLVEGLMRRWMGLIPK
jgi:hypothetical protein